MNVDAYAGIVYDLDGTLVDLPVDWGAARRDVAAALRSRGYSTDHSMGLWDLYTLAADADDLAVFEAELAPREREGARASRALPLVETLPHEVPVGVCSLNCESACREALERHGLADHVDVVVGRDSHPGRKPDPGPLLATLSALDVDPDRAVFVGDSERDATAARRAEVAFRWVDEWLAGE